MSTTDGASGSAGRPSVHGAQAPQELRNVAIIAHVDHGKTTLVDAMLRQTGAFGERAHIVDRVLDSNDQERERGITIFANLVDTPGHADFGGEVERGMAVVDGVLLLVDAAEGPLPQTRYVLSKALDRGLPVVVVLNKVDRADVRTQEVLDEVEHLVLDLVHDRPGSEAVLDFPVVSTISRDGRSVAGVGMPGEQDDLTALFEAIVKTIPAPSGDPEAPLQAIVNNLDASEYLGRLGVGRVVNGTLRRNTTVAVCQAGPEDGAPKIIRKRLSSLMAVDGLGRVEVDELAAGELFVVAGFADVEIGDTIADPTDPQPLPRLVVDEPVLAMTFGVNTSPTAGKSGKYMTSRHLRERLERELLANVSIRVRETGSPDVIEVAGRGELQLAVLIETMRREGYELCVSRPEVLVKMVDGKRHEPYEEVIVDVPDEHIGAATQSLGVRKGQMTDMRPGDTGRSIVTFSCPSRGLLGFRNELMTETRGTAIVHQHHLGYTPWVGDLPTRLGGAVVADRSGNATEYALDNLWSRATMFVEPGDETYEGMVVGENSRADEMLVNVCREKKLTNIRTHAHDDLVKLPPARKLTLETAIEFIGQDELVEVTPTAVRVRKRFLSESNRRRLNNSEARRNATMAD
jgi:GTP-binding protein